MTWFRVDDKFHAHPKVKRIPRGVRAEALGTWVLCGVWSADLEKDGWVPDYMVDELGGTIAGAEALVAVGLWKAKRGGYQFVNWSEYQPTREQNETRRQSERDRKADYRRRMAESTGASPQSVPPGHSQVPNTPSRSRPGPMTTDQSGEHVASDTPDARPTYPHGGEPVDNSRPDVQRIAEHAAKLTGLEVHPLLGNDIAEHFLARAKRPPRMATRYVIAALNAEPPHIVENFIHTGRWSA